MLQNNETQGFTQGSTVTKVCDNLICTPVSKVTKAWPTSCCCEQTPVCCRICQFRAAPNIQGLQGFRRTKRYLHLRAETLSRLRRPTATASIHMRVAEWITWSCTQGSSVTRVRPASCSSEHTHVRCKTNRINAAPKGRAVTRVRPTGSP